MRSKFWYTVMGAEAVLCVILSLLKIFTAESLPVVMAFPFEHIGMWLRTMSLSGAIGNILAMVIYCGLSLAPLLVLYFLRRKGRSHAADVLLVLLCVVLFFVLYLMVNPGDITTILGATAGLGVGKAILGGAFYSILFGYLVLRVLRISFRSGTENLQKYMGVIINLLNLIFIFSIFGSGFSGLLDSFASLQAGNKGNEQLLGPSYAFLAVQYIVNVTPYLLNIVIVFAAGRLISDMKADRYSEASIASAHRLSIYCRNSLVITIISQIAFNLLQLLFARQLRVVNSQVNVPVLSIVFVIAILLIARFLAESKQLKDDNDMII